MAFNYNSTDAPPPPPPPVPVSPPPPPPPVPHIPPEMLQQIIEEADATLKSIHNPRPTVTMASTSSEQTSLSKILGQLTEDISKLITHLFGDINWGSVILNTVTFLIVVFVIYKLYHCYNDWSEEQQRQHQQQLLLEQRRRQKPPAPSMTNLKARVKLDATGKGTLLVVDS